MVWKPNLSSTFTVKSLYMELSKSFGSCLGSSSQKIWKGLVPHRIEVFFWLALLERINTKKKLVHLKIIPREEINCPLCNSWPEEVSHLFLQCPVATELWAWWWEIWNIKWVWPSSLNLAFEQWSFPTSSKFFKKIWTASFLVIVWSLWKERNARVFNQKSCSLMEICNLILVRICWWLKAWKDPFPYSVDEVIRNPSCLNWNPKVIRRLNTHPAPSALARLKWVVSASSSAHGGNIGGILLNTNMEILCLFSCPCPPMTTCAAEVLAIHRALQISMSNKEFSKFPTRIASASRQAIQWCASRSSRSDDLPNLRFILNFIRSSLNRGLVISYVFQGSCMEEVNHALSINRIPRFSDVVAWM